MVIKKQIHIAMHMQEVKTILLTYIHASIHCNLQNSMRFEHAANLCKEFSPERERLYAESNSERLLKAHGLEAAHVGLMRPWSCIYIYRKLQLNGRKRKVVTYAIRLDRVTCEL